jgi:hypothetical protein
MGRTAGDPQFDFQDRKLTVKNTFLEIVEPPLDKRNRSLTDGAILEHLFGEVPSYSNLNSNERSDEPIRSHTTPNVAGFCEPHAPQTEQATIVPESTRLHSQQNSMQPSPSLRVAVDVDAVSARHSPAYAGATTPTPLPVGAHPTWFLPRDRRAPHQGQTVFSDSAAHSNFTAHNASVTSSPTDKESSAHQYTTVMLRNLPNKYTRSMLVDMLNTEGFVGKFNFVYLPVDFKTHAGLGYAFVDLTTSHEAQRMRQHFEGFSRWVLTSDKVCTVSWSHPQQQGYAAHVERYRNSPVMHDSVPDTWKPCLFSAGQRVVFPPPTRKIRPPRLFPAREMEK